MFPISSHTPCETSTNTIETSNSSVAKLVVDTRIVMRSVSSQPTPYLSPTNGAGLHQSDMPLPGTMKFNAAQAAFFNRHTRPKVSTKVQKLVTLSSIAYDQEKAGLHFEGRRSFAEAEVNLLEEKLTQSSQAARTQNPLSYFGNTIKEWVNSVSYYFVAEPTIENLYSQFSSPIGDSTYKVRKSTALEKTAFAGEVRSVIRSWRRHQ